MSMVKDLETKLEKLFKGLPPLSSSAKESLAGAWSWIALVVGILQLLAAFSLWHLVRRTTELTDYVNSYYQAVTGRNVGLSSFDKSMLYLGIIVLLVDSLILLMAFPKLKKRARAGWDLLFLGALLNVAYSVLSLFLHNRGFGSFLGGLVGSAIGFYLLFQVREKFGGKATSVTHTTPPATPAS